MSTFSLFGWSGGYVGFRHQNVAENARSQTLTIQTSKDGLAWATVQTLTIRSSKDIILPIAVGQLVEGPAGFVALAYFASPRSGYPGLAWMSAILRSRDGQHWDYASTQATFGSTEIATIDGGDSGYVVVGSSVNSGTSSLWVSSDGVTWRQPKLPPSMHLSVPDATGGGTPGALVFGAGSVAVAIEYSAEDETRQPSIWWSPDGLAWSQSSVPGLRPGPPTIGGITLTFNRIRGDLLLAKEQAYAREDAPAWTMAWASFDGRTWCGAAAAAAVWPGDILSDGQHVLFASLSSIPDAPLDIVSLRGDLGVAEVAQTGSVPAGTLLQEAMGPAGVVASDWDGTVFYVGALES